MAAKEVGEGDHGPRPRVPRICTCTHWYSSYTVVVVLSETDNDEGIDKVLNKSLCRAIELNAFPKMLLLSVD
jgi:hypothetical protein